MEVRGDNYIYQVDLKGKAKAMAMPCADGTTIYIDINLSEEEKIKALRHEEAHANGGDFQRLDVQKIEHRRHEDDKTL